MGSIHHDAPDWLRNAFIRAAKGVGATATREELGDAAELLIDRWSTAGREFHNLAHLTATLQRVDELASAAQSPDAVRLAAWYHGAVFAADAADAYAGRGGEQNPASAEVARAELTALGVPPLAANHVASLITTLLRHQPPAGNLDASVLVDADLAMLADDPQEFRLYAAAVRAEYAHIPDCDFVAARIAIIDRLLSRDRLYTTSAGAHWETAARQNLMGERVRLVKELTALAAAEPVEPD